MSTATPVRPSGLVRWAALGGVAYVVLFILGVIVSDSGQPDFDAPPAEVIKYWSDSGNRDQAALGWGLIVLGVFFFLWFLGALRRVPAPGRRRRPVDHAWPWSGAPVVRGAHAHGRRAAGRHPHNERRHLPGPGVPGADSRRQGCRATSSIPAEARARQR